MRVVHLQHQALPVEKCTVLGTLTIILQMDPQAHGAEGPRRGACGTLPLVVQPHRVMGSRVAFC